MAGIQEDAVRKSVLPHAYGLVTLAMLLMAMPQPAHAYVDPGSGAMLWQILAAAVIGSLFYVRKGFTWVREHLSMQSTRATEFSNEQVSSEREAHGEKIVETR